MARNEIITLVHKVPDSSDIELVTDGKDLRCMECLLSPARTEYATSATEPSGWPIMMSHVARHIKAGHKIPREIPTVEQARD